MAATDFLTVEIWTLREVTPVSYNSSAGSVGFSPSSVGWTGRWLSYDLMILDKSGEKGVHFAYNCGEARGGSRTARVT